MSYELIQGIRIKRDVKEVWLNAASNNVYPRHYRWEKSTSFTRILNEEDGERKVKAIILRLYWDGNFQEGVPNVYSKAAHYVQRHYPEITWDTVGEYRTKDLVDGPFEDLPKYINASRKIDQDIVRRRLSGEDVGLLSITDIILYSNEDLERLLFEALNKKLYLN